MTFTLELKPEVEARVMTQAAQHNLSIEKYLQMLVETATATRESSTPDTAVTPEERARAWEDFINAHEHIDAPPVLDDSRESIYREREDSQL